MNDLLAGVYGLLSALSWGSGDFSGGLASKRTSTFSVVVISQLFGAFLILGLAFFTEEPLTGWRNLAWGGAAGAAGAIGLTVLYQALSAGKMGLVAPVTSLISVLIPVLAGILLEGFPTAVQFAGILLALVAVWLVSQPALSKASLRGLLNRSFWQAPFVAGIGFGLFFILIDQVEAGSVYWPLVSARAASLILIFSSGLILGRLKKPAPGSLPAIFLAGFLDVGGNVFFVLAAQTGRLDISAILSSFYSAVTVFWAWILLREKLSISQWAGVIGVVISVVLITR